MHNSNMASLQVIGTNIELAFIAENAVLLSWPAQICPQQHQYIIALEQHIKKALASEIIDTVIAYHSLIIYYRFSLNSPPMWQQKLSSCINSYATLAATTTPTTDRIKEEVIEIPVYYGEDLAWDICDVAQDLSLSVQDVIYHHSNTIYRAYALGFTPAFCYLGSLPPILSLPRKSTPRKKIPMGAVAIAEQQTAVYPTESPGGWHIIGRTPVSMYHVSHDTFSPLIEPGKQVKFIPIDKKTFADYVSKEPTNTVLGKENNA